MLGNVLRKIAPLPVAAKVLLAALTALSLSVVLAFLVLIVAAASLVFILVFFRTSNVLCGGLRCTGSD